MAIETPATIAILGAGPIGLEAALYARFLGYAVDVYERGDIAANVRAWGHIKLFSPFALNRSSLGLAARASHDVSWMAPPDDALLTGREYVEQYLLPLSQTDLLADCVHQGAKVVSVGRADLLKAEDIGKSRRATAAFRLLIEDRQGNERVAEADVVIDATGTYGQHCWVGQGGIPAPGESAAAAQIAYHVPDVLHRDRDSYEGRRVLLVGAGYSAATSALALAELASANPETEVTWVTRRPLVEPQPGPIAIIPNDRLVERDQMAREANRLATGGDGTLQHYAGTWVEAVGSLPDGGLKVQLGGQHTLQLDVDCIIANVGYRPDNRLFSELQVHQCYASEGPMRLAATLVGQDSADCLEQKIASAEVLVTTEPNFYVLGSKSYGRNSKFLISIGLQQIVQLFTIIGDRQNLNLYDGVRDLVP